MSHGIHDYLDRNRDLARRLIGEQITSVTRLLFEPADADEEPRLVWGPALVTALSGAQWLLDAEESKANLLLLPSLGPPDTWYTLRSIRSPVVTDSEADPLRFLLHEPIRSIDVISREPEPGVPDSFAMCGLRWTTAGGNQVCVGTHLTQDAYPEIAFRLPSETDPALQYTAFA